jgi:hypothetical protein
MSSSVLPIHRIYIQPLGIAGFVYCGCYQARPIPPYVYECPFRSMLII